MFDTLSRPRPRRPAAGTAVSIAIHALVIGGALWLTAQKTYETVSPTPPILRFPGPARGAPAAGPRNAATPPKHRKKPRPAMVQPAEMPVPAAAPAARVEPVEEPAVEEEDPGSPNGVIGGAPGGDPNGVSGGPIAGIEVPPAPRPFEEGRMTPPERMSGPDPAYTPQALEREIEGTMVVRCVVTEQGMVHGCRVLRSLPYMDAAVIQALEHRRYRPALIDGRPVAVDYLFQIRLRLP